MNAPSGSRFIAFDVFVLDRQSHELTKDGTAIRLSEQPFLVLECLLEHRGEVVSRDELRRRVWPTDTFVDFEHGLNAVVKRLRDTLGDSVDAPRFIETVPRRGYRFVAPVAPTEARVTSSARENGRRRAMPWPLLAVVAVAVAVVAAALVVWQRTPSGTIDPPRIVSLSSLPGFERWPSLAPDGLGVAFAYEGEHDAGPRIYAGLVGAAGDPRRLTSGPGRDDFPAWSPDGRQIAFERLPGVGEQGYVHLVTPLGGSDSRLSDFPVFGPIAWSPDGRYIAVHSRPTPSRATGKQGIFFLPVAGGDPVEITPTMGPAFDAMPAFSRDGHRLAYMSCRIFGVCDVFSIDLDARGLPAGKPRRLTPRSVYFVWGIAWSPDGADVLYAPQGAYLTWLWRVAADGSRPPARVELAGPGARMPSSNPASGLLAYNRWDADANVHRFDLHGPGAPVVASTLPDFSPAVSPDGRSLAFISERSGDPIEIWVSGVDGSNAHPLLRGPHRWQGSPRWSPDSRHVAFNSLGPDGRWHIWIVAADGGAPRQITNGPDNEEAPSWSRDGRSIYFGAAAVPRGAGDLWRVRVDGGQPERVKSGAGPFAEESVDGRDVVYQASGQDSALMAMPVSDGPSRQLLPCVRSGGFAVTAHGIFYVTCDGRTAAVRLMNPETRRDRALGTLDGLLGGAPFSGLAVSPDGRSIFYSRGSGSGGDLLLIEHFK